MVAITVRNVPEDVRNELAARAARSGQSLQEYLVQHLEQLAARPTVDDVLGRARARVSHAGSRVAVQELLTARDADRP